MYCDWKGTLPPLDAVSHFSFLFWNFVLSVSSSFCCSFLISKCQAFLGKPSIEVVCHQSHKKRVMESPEKDREMLGFRDRKGWDRIHLVAGGKDNQWSPKKTPGCLTSRMSDSYKIWSSINRELGGKAVLSPLHSLSDKPQPSVCILRRPQVMLLWEVWEKAQWAAQSSVRTPKVQGELSHLPLFIFSLRTLQRWLHFAS